MNKPERAALTAQLAALGTDDLVALVLALIAQGEQVERAAARWLDARAGVKPALPALLADLARSFRVGVDEIHLGIAAQLDTIKHLATHHQRPEALELASALLAALVAYNDALDAYDLDVFDQESGDHFISVMDTLIEVSDGWRLDVAIFLWEQGDVSGKDGSMWWVVDEQTLCALVRLAPTLDAAERAALLVAVNAELAQDPSFNRAELRSLLAILDPTELDPVKRAAQLWERGDQAGALASVLLTHEQEALAYIERLSNPWRSASVVISSRRAGLMRALLERGEAGGYSMLELQAALYAQLVSDGDHEGALTLALSRFEGAPQSLNAALVEEAARRLDRWPHLRPAVIAGLEDPDELLAWRLAGGDRDEGPPQDKEAR